MLDLVVKGGTVLDGTGAPGRTADVGIKDGRVAEVGRITAPAARTLDADGLTVAPGWVDVHTHYDGQVCWDTELAPSSWHGVTTVVMGNCGIGFAPVRPQHRQFLIDLMEGVEDIPGTALSEGVNFTWESFAEYLSAIDRRYALDIAAQVPHGALRTYVMGERAASLATATADEAEQMGRLVEDAIRAGALGFSTSRTIFHRTRAGGPTPSLTAAAPELLAIARGLKRTGTGVVEWISDFDDLDAEFGLMLDVAREAGRPLAFSLAQLPWRPQEWRDMLGRIDAAQRDGIDIRAQVACRPIGVLLGLDGSLHPFMDYPAWQEIAGLPLAERVARLKDPAFRERLLANPPADRPQTLNNLLGNFACMYALGDPPNYEPAPETSLAAQAQRSGRRPQELALDMLLADGGTGLIYCPVRNYTEGNLEAVREMLQHRFTVPALGDGGAHVATLCDASVPTFAATWWGRDRPTGRLPLEWIVMRQTRDTALSVGLGDRGVIAPGYRADLNLIDFAHLNAAAPEMRYDLPAGGKRLVQKARGYEATLCAGTVTFQRGEATGALPGRLVRGARQH
jgi:N-acyl-D-aspartate/D-glutamate deacylase